MNNIFKLTPLLVVLVPIVLGTTTARSDALTKLEPKKLEAVHQAVQALRAEWKALPRLGPFREHRANLHVHSHWSHDSRGTIDEIVAAAKATGTSVLMFNEHPAEHYDFFKDGHQGIKGGVLLILEPSHRGFLLFQP